MKSLALLLTLALCSAAPVFADNPPPISARQALDIAEKDMASRDLPKKPYIISVTLEHPSMFGTTGNAFWMIHWSETVVESSSGKTEVGMKIRMDGTPVRLVKTH